MSDATRVEAVALKLLGRRDHSVAELRIKLGRRGFPETLVEQTLRVLGEQGFLDDVRVADVLATQRMDKGYGPIAIRHKLVERGIEPALADSVVSAIDTDWLAHALSTVERRCSAERLVEGDQRERARLARFLEARGFPTGIAIRALEQLERRIRTEAS